MKRNHLDDFRGRIKSINRSSNPDEDSSLLPTTLPITTEILLRHVKVNAIALKAKSISNISSLGRVLRETGGMASNIG